jgi:hypothetical protein
LTPPEDSCNVPLVSNTQEQEGDTQMSHEVETMFSGNRETPWHGLGNVVDGVLTAEEAIEAAGLNWTVSMRDVFRRKDAGPATSVMIWRPSARSRIGSS